MKDLALVKGPKFVAEPMNQIIAAINSTKLVRGDGILISENPSGELISALPRKKSSEATAKKKTFCWEPLNSLVYRFPDGTIDQKSTFTGKPPYWGIGCTSDNPGAKPGDTVTGELRMSITGEWADPQNSGILIWINGQQVPLNGFPLPSPAGIQMHSPQPLIVDITFDGVSKQGLLSLDSGAVVITDLQYTTTLTNQPWGLGVRSDGYVFFPPGTTPQNAPKYNRGTFTATGLFQLSNRCIQLGQTGDKIITLPDPNTGQSITYDCVYPFSGGFIQNNYDLAHPGGTIPTSIQELNLTCQDTDTGANNFTGFYTLFPPESNVWGLYKANQGQFTWWPGGYLPMPCSMIDDGEIVSDPLDIPTFVVNLYGSGTLQWNFFSGWYPANVTPPASSAAYMEARAEIAARSGTYDQWQAELAAILLDLARYWVFPATFDKPVSVDQFAHLSSPFYLHAINTSGS